MNIYLALVLIFAAICLGHIIGYTIRKREDLSSPVITILVEKDEDLPEVAEILNKKVVFMHTEHGKIIEGLHLGVFRPHCDVTKNKWGCKPMGKDRQNNFNDDWLYKRERRKKDKPGKKHNNQYHTNYTNAKKKQDKRYKNYD